MKAITLIILTLFIAKGCSQDKKDLEKAQVVYTAYSRGFYQKITIQNHEILVSNNRRDGGIGTTKKITDADWNELIGYFKNVDLDSLSTYKDPTQKRFYDGAAIANLKVTYKEKAYQTKEFDHEFPPTEIDKLVNKIVSLGKEKE